MAEKILVPVYVPTWLREPLEKAKRALIPRQPIVANIDGERHIEWSFICAEMPEGPGNAIEFGCEHGYMSLMAARKGFHVIANDLQRQSFLWKHPNVEFQQGDFRKLVLAADHFDLAINCSSVEHVGIAGRYGIELAHEDGDIEVMDRLAEVLKASGRLLMTAPCGMDAVMAPWCRVYGARRLPKLLRSFVVLKEEFWVKNDQNQWMRSTRDAALALPPRHDPLNPHGCAYALGCFALGKRR